MFSLVEFPFQDDLNILLYTVTDSYNFQMRQLGIYLTIAHLAAHSKDIVLTHTRVVALLTLMTWFHTMTQFE